MNKSRGSLVVRNIIRLHPPIEHLIFREFKRRVDAARRDRPHPGAVQFAQFCAAIERNRNKTTSVPRASKRSLASGKQTPPSSSLEQKQ